MKKLLVFILIIFSAWIYYTKNMNARSVYGSSVPSGDVESDQFVTPQSKYVCDGRQHCSQMGLYEEAVFFIRNCPNTKMDGDGDGVPCERQFGR